MNLLLENGWLGVLFGSIAVLSGSILTYAFDDRRAILGFKLLGIASTGVYYGIIGAYTAIFNIAITFTFLILSLFRKRLPHPNSPLYPLAFLLLNTYLSLNKWQSFASIFSYLGSCLNVIGRWQLKPMRIRLIAFCAMLMWATYNISVHAWFPLLANGITFISLITAMIRFDRKKTK